MVAFAKQSHRIYQNFMLMSWLETTVHTNGFRYDLFVQPVAVTPDKAGQSKKII